MPKNVRLWEIRGGDTLRPVKRAALDVEARIEGWLEEDISILSDDLLVIGRQVPTDFGGSIDLLCLDSNGDVVIVELKRDRTQREVTAQVLDYGTWVKDLSNESITEIATEYLSDEDTLEEVFRRELEVELPEVLNENHRMLIVASKIDGRSERIIGYLSDTYGVSINAITFEYFQDEEGREFLARVFLLDPSEVEYKAQIKKGTKRKPPLTYEELQAIAETRQVDDLYEQLLKGLTDIFDQRTTTRSTVAFIGLIEERRRTIFSIVPGESSAEKGLRFSIYINRLQEYLGVDREAFMQILPSQIEKGEAYRSGPAMIFGFFKDVVEIESFLSGMSRLKAE